MDAMPTQATGDGRPGPPAIDTRRPDGPGGRLYAAPFAVVWEVLKAEVGRRRLWEVVHADEDMGLVTVLCRRPPPFPASDLNVWIGLDENGLTRVDGRCSSRGRWPGGTAAELRRLRSLLDAIDRRLGAGARVRD